MKISRLIAWGLLIASLVMLHIKSEGYRCDHQYTIPATCTDYGNCPVCQRRERPLGHSYILTSRTDPTCTEHGKEVYTCSVCSQVNEEFLRAMGHSVKTWKTKRVATESKPGMEQGFCETCQKTVEQPIPELGSVPSSPLSISAQNLYTRAMKKDNKIEYKYVRVRGRVKGIRVSGYRNQYLIAGNWDKGVICQIYQFPQPNDISAGSTATFTGCVFIEKKVVWLRSAKVTR